MEKEGGISGFRRCYRVRKKNIKVSKYVSEVLQKHRLLDPKRYGTGSYHRVEKHIPAMAKFIKKCRNTGQIVSGEAVWPTLCPYHTEVVTGILFGRPIIQSFAKMLSKFHAKIYGGTLEHIEEEVLDSSFGQIAKGDGGRLAKWFHVNYIALHKDDNGCYFLKLYFAEVIAFKFRFAGPLFCNVVKCLPLEDDGSETCKCLFPNCHPRIQHPSENAYVDAYLHPVSSSFSLWSTAKIVFSEVFWYPYSNSTRIVWLARPSWPGGRIPVDKLNCIASPSNYNLRRGGNSGAEAEIEYLYQSQNTFTNMSKHIPVPKMFLLSEVKRQNNGPAEIQKRALAIAKYVEDRKRPRMREPIICPLLKDLLSELPEFCKETKGDDLEELNGFITNDKICPERRDFTQATWIHVNFSAKRKNEDSGVSENLYFAEVVMISHLFQEPIYKVKVCVPVDKNHPSGTCGICNIHRHEICHPSQGGSYIDDTSKMDPSEFSEWKEGPNSFEEALGGRDLGEVCCGN